MVASIARALEAERTARLLAPLHLPEDEPEDDMDPNIFAESPKKPKPKPKKRSAKS